MERAVTCKLSEDQKFFLERLKLRIQKKYATNQIDCNLVPGLKLTYLTSDIVNRSCFYTLSGALILQGKKKVSIGGDAYYLGEGCMIVTSIDLPASSETLGASMENPFIALSLKLDPSIFAGIAHELDESNVGQETFDPEQGSNQAICVTEALFEILQVYDKILGLVDEPIKRKSLLPIALKELHCLLYLHAQNNNLRQLCDNDSALQRIQKSVSWIKNHYREPLKLEHLAEIANMAPSTFHLHFKKVISVSPLQYQKILRLHEARRLMFSQLANASIAAFTVGYESP